MTDFFKMLGQFKEMQGKLEQAQEALSRSSFYAASGGGMVVTSCATCTFMLQRNAPPSVQVANLATAMAQLSGTPFTPPAARGSDDDDF